jgi:hypothetical protein
MNGNYLEVALTMVLVLDTYVMVVLRHSLILLAYRIDPSINIYTDSGSSSYVYLSGVD